MLYDLSLDRMSTLGQLTNQNGHDKDISQVNHSLNFLLTLAK